MKFYGALESAALESLTTDPTISVQGRIYYNSASAKFMLDDGTLKRALLRNDQNMVIGSDPSAANNVRLNRAASGYLQIVLGNDTTAEGTVSMNLAQFGHRFPNFATNPTAGNAGRVIYNTTSSSLQLDLGASYLQLASLSGTETLTNKTLTTPALDIATVTDQTATPATPASGATKVYTRAGQLYKLGSDGLETLVGSGSGSGNFNYLTNGSFEAGITTANLAKATVTAGLPTGTVNNAPGTSTLALALNTAAPLRGTKSLQVTGTSWAQGDGLALGPAFTVNPEDAGKVLTYSLAYQVTTGSTLMNFSGQIASQTMALAVYDVTNAAFVAAPPGAYGINSASIPGIVSCTIQTSVTAGQQYQVYLFNLGATVSGNTIVLLDDVVVGPTKVINGAIVTAWQTYTPVVSATTTAPTRPTTYTEVARWRRVGGDMEIEYYISWSSATGAANGSGAYLVGLPAIGVSVDNNLKPVGVQQNVCGSFRAVDSTNAMIGNAFVYSATQIACYGKYSTAGASATSIVDAAWGSAGFGFTNANGTTTIAYTAKVPIAGWAGGATQMSTDTDTRVIAARAFTTTIGNQGTIGTSATNVKYDTIANDTSGSYAVSGVYTVPVTGYYDIAAGIQLAAQPSSATSPGGLVLQLQNLTTSQTVASNQVVTSGTSTNAFNVPLSVKAVFLSANTQIAIQAYYGGSYSTNPSYYGPTNANYFSISRVSGPSTISAVETVAMRYTNVAGTSVASGATTIIPFTTKTYDTHAGNGASAYSAPVSGKYRVTVTLFTAAVTLTAAQAINSYVYVNGVQYSLLQSVFGNGNASGQYSPSGADTIQCNANDQISVYMFNGASAAATLATGAGLNHVCIERVGN